MGNLSKTNNKLDLEVPEYFNFSCDVLDKLAEDPDKLALWWVDDNGTESKITFDQLCKESRKVCNVLKKQGLNREDLVIVILPRLIEWWVIKVACIRMGVVFCPGTTQLTASDIEYRIDTSKAVCLITDTTVAAKINSKALLFKSLKAKIVVGSSVNGWESYNYLFADAAEDFDTVNTRSDENALLYFTSGTTDNPKLVVHTHSSYPIGHRITGIVWLGLNGNDLHWNVSDTGWAKSSWSSFFAPWSTGSSIFVYHCQTFNVKKMLRILCEYPITTLCAAPTVYRMFVLEDLSEYKFHSLRDCVAAGEPLNSEVIEIWKKATGITIRDGYGQTESVLLVGNFPDVEVRAGSMGKPAPGFDVKILDENSNIVPVNCEGDIAVKVKPDFPIGLFKEYWNNPLATSTALSGDWYLTGDRAYSDEDGYLWFVGRSDDVILSAGYRIGPFEVESALIEHESVAESAVVSSPDDVRGEVVKAFIVLKPGIRPSDNLVKEIQEHTKSVTAPYKYPRKIEFVKSLPKTVSGKIRRVELRNREWL